jgi:hypothetical protein
MASALVVAGAGGPGCHAGSGTLTGDSGGTPLSGLGGKLAGGRGGGPGGVGGHSIIIGTAGVGPLTGSGGTYDDGCRGPMPAKRLPANIVMVLDTSSSMNDDAAGGSCLGGCGGASKWSAVVSGLDSVLGSPGLVVNWGLQFIGVGDACTAGPILVTTGPGTGLPIMEELANYTRGGNLALTGNTPTREAVRNAVFFLSGLPGLLVPGPQAILLVTDGEPDCGAGVADPRAPDTEAAVGAITEAAVQGVPTFVVGVGALGVATDDAVSRMAAAGGLARSGSPAYYPVADAIDVVNTINQMVSTVGTCMFAVPPPPTSNGTTSREDIAVFADDKQVPQDANDGWTYGDSSHSTVTFHGSSCDAVRAGTARQVTITFLCLI